MTDATTPTSPATAPAVPAPPDLPPRPSQLTREEMYAAVWTKPMRDIARWIGVSDVGLAKICARLNVPHPSRGYWVRVATGRSPDKPDLPPPRPGDPLAWSATGAVVPRQPAVEPQAPLPLTPTDPTKLTRKRGPHPLTTSAREHFDAAIAGRGWYLKPAKKLLLHLAVSKATLERALTFADALFQTCEGRGHHVAIAPSMEGWQHRQLEEREPNQAAAKLRPDYDSYHRDLWSPIRPTVVSIGTVAIGLTVFETSEYVDAEYEEFRYVRVRPRPERKGRRASFNDTPYVTKAYLPSGRLGLRAFAPYERTTWEQTWRESTPGTLIVQIPEIIAALDKAAPLIVEQIAAVRRQQEIERKEAEVLRQKWQREHEQQQVTAAVKASVDDLQHLADAWANRTRFERFFEDVADCAATLPDAERDAVHARIRRARSLLNPLDPVERLRTWKAPEERVPSSLHSQFAYALPVSDQPPAPPASTSSSPSTAPQKSYWENQHWWQRR